MARPLKPTTTLPSSRISRIWGLSSSLCKRLFVLTHISQGLANFFVGHPIGLPSRRQDDLANGPPTEPRGCIARASLARRIAIQHEDDFSEPVDQEVGLLLG